MTTKVFISYRREDSAGYAGRVRDRLASTFGSDLVFMDVDGIPLGSNFVKVLQGEVATCSALLAVIGRGWLDMCDAQGRRRLDQPDDFVRVEIAAALQRNIPVIPILLDDTKIPRRDQLPADMQELVLRNGLAVRDASFHSDIDILIRALKAQLGAAAGETPGSKVRAPHVIAPAWLRTNLSYVIALSVAAVIAAVAVVWTATGPQKGAPQQSAPQQGAPSVTTSGPQSPVIQGTRGDVRIDFNAPEAGRK